MYEWGATGSAADDADNVLSKCKCMHVWPRYTPCILVQATCGVSSVCVHKPWAMHMWSMYTPMPTDAGLACSAVTRSGRTGVATNNQ